MPETPRPGLRGRTLVRGAAILFVARILMAMLAFVQVMLLSRYFGTSGETDAFFVAQMICFLFSGVLETCLNLAFVPMFMHTREASGDAEAWRLARGLFRTALVMLLAASFVLYAAAPWLPRLVAPGMSPASHALASELIRMMSPVMPILFAAAFFATMDFVAERYVMAGVALIVHAVGGPLALLLFADVLGVRALAAGIVCGVVARTALLAVAYPFKARMRGRGVAPTDPLMRRMVRMIGARLMTSWFVELNLFVDRIFASLLGPGFISCLAYASRGVMFIVQIVMMPLGRVLMPALSRLAAQHDYESMRRTMSQLVRLVGFLVIPMAVYVSTYRFELLELLLKRGAFTDQSVDLTAYALLFYSLGIVPFLLTPLLNGTFFAMQNSRIPLKIGAVAVAANVVLDAILIHALGHGGIALATSLVGFVRASLLWVFLRRRLGDLRTATTLGSLLLSVIAACAAFWGAGAIAAWLPLTVIPSTLVAGIIAHAAYGAVLYVVFQALFNRGIVRQFVRLVRRRGGGLAG